MEDRITSDSERRFWEAYWSGQRDTVTARTMTQVLDRIKLGYLKAILPKDGSTLEVGCGSGRLSCWLAKEGYRTFCLDSSRNALASARANYASARARGGFIAGEGMGLPVRDASVDVVLSTGLLEHFPDPAPIVREMMRVLKPGGLFYSDIVPKKFSLFRSLDWVGRLKRSALQSGVPSDGFFERAFTGDEIRTLLRESGLNEVEVFSAGVIPPYVPLLSRSNRLREAQVRLVERTQHLWKAMDRTCLAEWLGFYYFVWAVKPARI